MANGLISVSRNNPASPPYTNGPYSWDALVHNLASGGAIAANALLNGVGTSASPATTSVAGKFFLEYRCQSTATSGDNRLLYMRYELNGTGGGECLRAFTKVTAVVGTARGAHISLDVSTTGAISGLGVGVDAQLLLPGEAGVSGTWACVNAEIFTVASTTVGSITALSMFRAGASGDSTAINNIDDNGFFLELFGITAATGNIIDTNITTHTAYGGLKVKIPGVGTRWLALVSA